MSTVMNLMELLTFGKTDLLDEEERKRPDLEPVIESGQCCQDLSATIECTTGKSRIKKKCVKTGFADRHHLSRT